MATGQTLLDYMEVLDRELQLQSSESDVVMGLRAANMAQYAFEAVVGVIPNLLGSQTGTVTTTSSTETTAFPTGLLRVDALFLIDAATSRPAWRLEPISEIGGHAGGAWLQQYASVSGGSGKPVAYFTNGRSFYWDPLPDGTHTVRWHGFQAASDITAAGTFAYPDICLEPIAAAAVRLLRGGLGDDTGDITSLSGDLFQPVIQILSGYQKDRAPMPRFRYQHES
jgi:hypothetical protein